MIDQRDLKNIAGRIVALYGPERIYLFGSYAKGLMTERSDLDLLVVKRTSLPRYLRGRDVVSALGQFAIQIDLVFVTPEELERECRMTHSFLRRAMATAFLIYKGWPAPIFLCDKVPVMFESQFE